MKLILQGIDPGIVDTGMVSMVFDFSAKTLTNTGRTWTGVATRRGHSLHVSPVFLTQILKVTEGDNPKKGDYSRYTYIEGFRNRGRDSHQDQTMTVLVQSIQRQLAGSRVIDNTGIRKVVTRDLLQLFEVSRWPRTNHSDLLSASRVALKGALEDPELNQLIASVVMEQHERETWEIKTTHIG